MSVKFSSIGSTGLGICKQGYHTTPNREQRIEILRYRLERTPKTSPEYTIVERELKGLLQ